MNGQKQSRNGIKEEEAKVPKMTDWRAKQLEDLAKIDADIRRTEAVKKRINKEHNDAIKDLEEMRDAILDKLAGGEEKELFDEGETDPEIKPEPEVMRTGYCWECDIETIIGEQEPFVCAACSAALEENPKEPEEPKSTIEFDEEPVPEVGDYLGEPPEQPPGDPEPPPELEDPESFMGE